MLIEPLKPYLIDSPLHVGFAWHYAERPGYSIARFTELKPPLVADKPILLVSTFTAPRVRTFQGEAPVNAVISWLVVIGETLLGKELIYSFAVVPLDPLEAPKVSGEYEDLITKRLAIHADLAHVQLDVGEFDSVGDINHDH